MKTQLISNPHADKAFDIGSRLELFVDDYLIDRMSGAALALHKPTPREVAIVHDQPWEGNTCGYHTVFRDDNHFKMYHRGSDHDQQAQNSKHEVVCYAESEDGIHWTKPDLGLVDFNGSKQNNIVWDGAGSHNFAPFKDTNPNCKADRKYKALAGGAGGLHAFKSSDGIRWSLMSDGPVITKGAFDSQNLAFWDTTRNAYVDFHRGANTTGNTRVRDIMTCISADFIHWTEPAWIQYPGAPIEHLYTNQITPYYRAPHIFMGFPKRFMPTRHIGEAADKGVSDGVFMTSRDGLRFKRWGEAFIRSGLQKERWINRNNMTSWGILETASDIPGTPNELSIYSTEGYYGGGSCRLRRFTLRLDGFVSVQAPLSGGEIVTRSLVFDGSALVINFSTSGVGSVQVEVQNSEGKAIEGFALADSEIYGDEIAHVVIWSGGSDLRSLAGKPIRLRFVLRDADVYSFRFC